MKEEYLSILKDLIKIKSLSGQEQELGTHIMRKLRSWGLKPKKQGQNVVLHIKGVVSKKAVIINSHMDTVGPGEKEWTIDPFKPNVVGNKLIGLGASDMKSGLTASMLLAKIYRHETPPIDMWFTYVVKEEIDGSGTAQFSEWFDKKGFYKRYKEIGAIFTEPTSLMEIEHGHRGNFFFRVTTKGDSGHSARPIKQKEHAVRKMLDFSTAFQKETVKWNKKHTSKYFKPAVTLGELTSIKAGVKIGCEEEDCMVIPESPNKFPSVCVATFDLRTVHSFHNIAQQEVKKLAKKYDAEVELEYPDAPAGFTDPKDKLILVAKKNLKKAKLTTSQGSADQGFLSTKGVSAIIIGPGEKLQSHKVNEYCYHKQIPQSVEIYKNIVEDWAK